MVNSAEDVLDEMNAEIEEIDRDAGRMKAKLGAAQIKISVDTLTKSTQRIRISSRKTIFPDLNTANKILVKIMERLR